MKMNRLSEANLAHVIVECRRAASRGEVTEARQLLTEARSIVTRYGTEQQARWAINLEGAEMEIDAAVRRSGQTESK
ncbi:hypothetical protein [Caudoviricetes sp.]|nr:hypothetical protein [Caudoviricetes sp.]